MSVNHEGLHVYMSKIIGENADGSWAVQPHLTSSPRGNVPGIIGARYTYGQDVAMADMGNDNQKPQILETRSGTRHVRNREFKGWSMMGQDGSRNYASQDAMVPAEIKFDPNFNIEGIAIEKRSSVKFDAKSQQLLIGYWDEKDSKNKINVYALRDPKFGTDDPPNRIPNMTLPIPASTKPYTEIVIPGGVAFGTTWIVSNGVWYGCGTNSENKFQVDAVDLQTKSIKWSYTEEYFGSGYGLYADESRDSLIVIRYQDDDAHASPVKFSKFRIIALKLTAPPPETSQFMRSLYGDVSQRRWIKDVLTDATKPMVVGSTGDSFLYDKDTGKLVLWWGEHNDPVVQYTYVVRVPTEYIDPELPQYNAWGKWAYSRYSVKITICTVDISTATGSFPPTSVVKTVLYPDFPMTGNASGPTYVLLCGKYLIMLLNKSWYTAGPTAPVGSSLVDPDDPKIHDTVRGSKATVLVGFNIDTGSKWETLVELKENLTIGEPGEHVRGTYVAYLTDIGYSVVEPTPIDSSWGAYLYWGVLGCDSNNEMVYLKRDEFVEPVLPIVSDNLHDYPSATKYSHSANPCMLRRYNPGSGELYGEVAMPIHDIFEANLNLPSEYTESIYSYSISCFAGAANATGGCAVIIRTLTGLGAPVDGKPYRQDIGIWSSIGSFIDWVVPDKYIPSQNIFNGFHPTTGSDWKKTKPVPDARLGMFNPPYMSTTTGFANALPYRLGEREVVLVGGAMYVVCTDNVLRRII